MRLKPDDKQRWYLPGEPPHFTLVEKSRRRIYGEQSTAFLAQLRAAIPDGVSLFHFGALAGAVVRRPVQSVDHDNKELPGFVVGKEPDADEFRSIRKISAPWGRLGVGPFRTLYYLNALNSSWSTPDYLSIGEWPDSQHPEPEKYNPRMRGFAHTGSAEEWAAYDAFYTDVFSRLGLSWLVVEKFLLAHFRKSLPLYYQQALALAKVPSALVPLLWKHDLERWHYLRQSGWKIQEQVEQLTALLSATPYSAQYLPCLRDLHELGGTGSFMPQEQLQVYCGIKSPVITSVCKALTTVLWKQMATVEQPHLRSNPYWWWVEAIATAKHNRADEELLPEEYRWLVSDILYHLPILRGLPEFRRNVDGYSDYVPPMSSEAIRKRVERSKTPKTEDGS